MAIEKIGDALELFALDYHRRLELEHPPRREPTDATVTRLPTDEDLIRATHGGDSDEPIEDWVRIGPRESKFIADEEDVETEKDK